MNLASALLAGKHHEEVIALCSELTRSADPQIAGSAYHLRGSAYLGQAAIAQATRDFRVAQDLGWNSQRALIDLREWQQHLDEAE